MNTTLENINEIMIVKRELKNILKAVGAEPDDNFDNYAYLFSYIIAGLNKDADDIENR